MSKEKSKEKEGRAPSGKDSIEPAISVDIDPHTDLLDFDTGVGKSKGSSKSNPYKHSDLV